MGIFDKLFNNKKDEDNKHVLSASLGFLLAASDGDASPDEGKWIGQYIASIPGMTQERHKRIIDRSISEGTEALKIAPSLSEDERIELVNFMIGVATADGYFHGKEAAFILTFSMFIGFSKDQAMNIMDHLFSEHEIDNNEFQNACKEMKKFMDNRLG